MGSSPSGRAIAARVGLWREWFTLPGTRQLRSMTSEVRNGKLLRAAAVGAEHVLGQPKVVSVARGGGIAVLAAAAGGNWEL